MTEESAAYKPVRNPKQPLFSETDVRLLIMTAAGVGGCVLGFVMGLVAGRG